MRCIYLFCKSKLTEKEGKNGEEERDSTCLFTHQHKTSLKTGARSFIQVSFMTGKGSFGHEQGAGLEVEQDMNGHPYVMATSQKATLPTTTLSQSLMKALSLGFFWIMVAHAHREVITENYMYHRNLDRHGKKMKLAKPKEINHYRHFTSSKAFCNRVTSPKSQFVWWDCC